MIQHPTVQPLQLIALQVPRTSEQLSVRPLFDKSFVDTTGLSNRRWTEERGILSANQSYSVTVLSEGVAGVEMSAEKELCGCESLADCGLGVSDYYCI